MWGDDGCEGGGVRRNDVGRRWGGMMGCEGMRRGGWEEVCNSAEWRQKRINSSIVLLRSARYNAFYCFPHICLYTLIPSVTSTFYTDSIANMWPSWASLTHAMIPLRIQPLYEMSTHHCCFRVHTRLMPRLRSTHLMTYAPAYYG